MGLEVNCQSESDKDSDNDDAREDSEAISDCDVCEDSEVISDKVGTKGDSDVCEDIEVQKRRNVNRIGGGGGGPKGVSNINLAYFIHIMPKIGGAKAPSAPPPPPPPLPGSYAMKLSVIKLAQGVTVLLKSSVITLAQHHYHPLCQCQQDYYPLCQRYH